MNINRAIPPEGKIVYYRPDGTGRDTYIKEINGGLLSKNRIHSLKQFKPPKERNFSFSKTQYNRHPHSFQNGQSNNFSHYISDGSGRDFYVKSTEGGNNTPFRWRDKTDYKFKSILRNHTPYRNSNPQNQDTFLKSQMKSTLRQTNFRKGVAPAQRQLDIRLSQPKRVYAPPPVHTYYRQSFKTNRTTKICEQDKRRPNYSYTQNCIHKQH